MIYLFYGTDVEKARAKAFEWVAKARAKEPNLAYARLAREEITEAALEEASLSGGLFVKRLLVLLDDPFPSTRIESDEEDAAEEVATGDVIIDKLDMLAASDNAIIILAPKLSAAKAKKLVAKAKITYEFNESARPFLPAGRQGFNTNLVNAIAARSRQMLWLEINRALRAGDAPEMLHGLLHWKARDLMDLPAGRQERAGAWSPSESRKLSLALIALIQDSRRKGMDLSESLERFALSI